MSGTHTLQGVMQDGRFFTDYSPACVAISKFAATAPAKPSDSNAMRSALQQNGMSFLAEKPVCGPLQCSDYGVAITENPTAVTPPYTDGDRVE